MCMPMAYRNAPIPMTLSDFQGHTLIERLLKCDFSHSYTAVDKITMTAYRKVHQLFFLGDIL